MVYIVSQIIGFIAFIVSLIAYHRKDKKNILGNMILCHVLKMVHYIMLGAFSGCATKLLAIFRDYFILLKDKHPRLSKIWYLFIFIIAYVICMVITYDGIVSVLPLVAAIVYMTVIWNGNEMQIKKAAFFCYFLWLAYNIFVLSIAGVVSNVISIISTFIAIVTYKKSLLNE